MFFCFWNPAPPMTLAASPSLTGLTEPREAADWDAMIAAVDGHPLRMAWLAHRLLTKGRPAKARELCARALALAPGEPEIATIGNEIFCDGVPEWHASIANDLPRNAAYDAALRRAIKPGDRVLEIGTGSGILAMMAARAGAAEVVTCEMNPVVAERATQIIAQNGYADRVRVIAKHSDALRLGVDLSRRADILVSEIIGPTLLGENVLPVMDMVAHRLLRDGGTVIPSHGSVRVALADYALAEKRRMGMIDGFDLSAFNGILPPDFPLGVGNRRLTLRSAAADLFTFDFQAEIPESGRASITLRAQGGTANGIVQWIRLQMDDVTVYENQPNLAATSSWDTIFHPLAVGHEAKADQDVAVHGSHDINSVRIWASP
jgi:type III protein arginine methyltransferase